LYAINAAAISRVEKVRLAYVHLCNIFLEIGFSHVAIWPNW